MMAEDHRKQLPSITVKYFVVTQENDSGLAKARPAKTTVHKGNRLVSVSVVFR